MSVKLVQFFFSILRISAAAPGKLGDARAKWGLSQQSFWRGWMCGDGGWVVERRPPDGNAHFGCRAQLVLLWTVFFFWFFLTFFFLLFFRYSFGLLTSNFSRFVAPQLARFYASKSFPPHHVIDMPALSPTMTQGNVGVWQKEVGDKLEPGEALVEIETDKASMDFEFQDDGYLAKVLLPAGTKDVAVGKPIGVYVEDEADVSAFADFTLEDAGGSAAPAPAKEAPKEETKETKEAAPAKEDKPASTEKKTQASSEPTGRIIASPVAKMIALEKGIPLKDIQGSGPNGRIIKKDVENWEPAAAPAAAAAPVASKSAPAAAAAAAAAPAGASYEDTPISNMRKTIAARLTQSKQSNPDYIVSSTIRVGKLLKLRQALNAEADGRYKISVNDILIKAMTVASKEIPQVNSHWLEAEGVIRAFKNVDVSVAVATPTGLITPVITNADSKGLASISNEMKALGKKARDGKLAPHEYQGGTITISNMGMNPAVSFFSAIINPPQAAIIAIGTVEKIAVEDADSESGFAFEEVLRATGTFDHKVIDGAVGGEWMKVFKRVLENPLELLL